MPKGLKSKMADMSLQNGLPGFFFRSPSMGKIEDKATSLLPIVHMTATDCNAAAYANLNNGERKLFWNVSDSYDAKNRNRLLLDYVMFLKGSTDKLVFFWGGGGSKK